MAQNTAVFGRLQYYGTAAERAAFTPLFVWTQWLETDTESIYIWDGDSWITTASGGGSVGGSGVAGQVAYWTAATTIGGDASLTYNAVTNSLGVDNIQWNLTPTPIAPAEGLMYWNTDDGTLNLGMPGGNVNLQLGQEMNIRAKNETGAPITNGQLVYISGGTGNRPLISLAKADAAATSDRMIGMATETIPDNQFGYVTTTGYVRDVDTLAYAPGTPLYLSVTTAGAYTSTEPTAPNHASRVGQVIRQSATEGIIYINIRPGWHLFELHDANYNPGTVASGDLLRWNGTIWTNSTPAAAGLAQGAGTLTVATINDASIANHTHAITSSSNPGATASILSSDSSGYLQLTGIGLGTAVTSSERLRANITTGGTGYTGGRFTVTMGGNHNQISSFRAEINLGAASSGTGNNMPRGVFGLVNATTSVTTNTAASFLARVTQSNGTITNWHGLSVLTPSLTGGTLTNAYGLYMEDISGGATLNYAIYTNAGQIRFGDMIQQVETDTATNTATTLYTFDHNTSNTPTTNYGTSILWRLESSTTADQNAGLVTVAWADATHASRAAYATIGVYYTTTPREAIRFTATSVGSYATFGGGWRVAVAIKSADYTLTTSDHTVVWTATSTATLPPATGSGQTYRLICRTGTLTITPDGSDTIKGAASQAIVAGEDLILSDVEAGAWE